MEKRDFLMIYDNKWNIPNGDPFTGEQRFDSSNDKIMVSDLRIKRFIRDKLIEFNRNVFCKFDEIEAKKIKEKITGSAFSFRQLLLKENITKTIDEKIDSKKIKSLDINKLMRSFLDVRLFGGLLTEEGQNASIEGAVQFKNLSYSFNRVCPEVFQNTTVFPSSIDKSQGSIGTTTLIPYSVIGIDGWLNEKTAEINELTDEDLEEMIACMWIGIRDKNTRSKSGANPILFFEVVYKEEQYKFDENIKIYKKINKNLSDLISIKSDLDEKDIRSCDDYEFCFDKLIYEINKDNVKFVNYYTEDEKIKNIFSDNKKFIFKKII